MCIIHSKIYYLRTVSFLCPDAYIRVMILYVFYHTGNKIGNMRRKTSVTQKHGGREFLWVWFFAFLCVMLCYVMLWLFAGCRVFFPVLWADNSVKSCLQWGIIINWCESKPHYPLIILTDALDQRNYGQIWKRIQ